MLQPVTTYSNYKVKLTLYTVYDCQTLTFGLTISNGRGKCFTFEDILKEVATMQNDLKFIASANKMVVRTGELLHAVFSQ